MSSEKERVHRSEDMLCIEHCSTRKHAPLTHRSKRIENINERQGQLYVTFFERLLIQAMDISSKRSFL